MAVHGLLPPYLAGDCQLVSTTRRRQLWSSNIPTLVVHRTWARPHVSATDASVAPQRRSRIDFHRRWWIREWHIDSSVRSWRVTSLFEWDCDAQWLRIQRVGLYSYLLTYLLTLYWTVTTMSQSWLWLLHNTLFGSGFEIIHDYIGYSSFQRSCLHISSVYSVRWNVICWSERRRIVTSRS